MASYPYRGTVIRVKTQPDGYTSAEVDTDGDGRIDDDILFYRAPGVAPIQNGDQLDIVFEDGRRVWTSVRRAGVELLGRTFI